MAGLTIREMQLVRVTGMLDPSWHWAGEKDTVHPLHRFAEFRRRPTPIPDDCLFERSRDLRAIALTGRHKSYEVADYFNTTWATDGNLYATCGEGVAAPLAARKRVATPEVDVAEVQRMLAG